jgi:MOSC domain-containing protein YiiM
MASKAMRITDLSCGTDTWRAAIRRRPTFGRSTLSRANCSTRSGRAASTSAGDLGENITTVGLDLEFLPLGTELLLGASATLKLTGVRTPCVLIDYFKAGVKDRLQGGPNGPRFRSGVMAIVSEGGDVSLGDLTRAVRPSPPHLGPSAALN